MKKITALIILCFVFPAHNTIQTAAHNIFVLDTKDLNNNGINDVLTFSGKNIVKKRTKKKKNIPLIISYRKYC